ncbi:MAG: DUF11 domain-containing protein, partial [Chitinophagales bacterium]|nr:DUF11 domain-containing protein [Chitinophagales bacterium]
GETTQSLSGLTAGTYSVTVTDANGCTDECTTTVQEPGCSLTASASGTNVLCTGGADGTASASATGNTGAVTYLWSNGETTQNISSLTAGTYSVTITETPTCTAVASYTVTEPSAAVDATCSKTDVTTNGGADGTASVSASGGTSPYTYLWNTGATTSSISGLVAGTYSVTVTDANGCTDECTTTVQEPGCSLTASASGTNVLCNGGADGTATATASGNTGAVTYLWSNGATTASISSLAVGTYSVTITETPTCTAVASYTVTEPSAALDATCSKTDVTTNGGADGTASVSASGGTSPYTYLWNTGATTASISGLTAGTYSVTVTDANGCTDECTTTVQEPGCNLTASASGTNVLCTGGADGTASATASGNLGAVTYLWSNGATTQNVNSLAAGTYSVTITETPTCTAVASYTVTEPSAALDATCSKTDVTTNGGADGTASVSASGGTSPYTYLWNTGATTASISGLTAGTYSVTVTDANGCSDACTTVINAPNAPPNLSLTKTAPCLGTNGGTITFTLTVENIGATDATGVVVTDDLIVAGLTYVSHTPSSITYNAAANTFAVGTVPANSSVSFDITVQIPATGYYFCNDAAITFLNEQDFSSGNDAARACFTTPATICPGQTFTLSVDASYTNVLWFKDGNATPVGSGNTYVATSEGSYTWTATEQSCPQGGCCPFIITLGDCCPIPICLPITIKRVQP